MANYQYIKGRRLEYEVKKDLEKKGFFATRTPGSKTPADVIAIKLPTVHWVQCKTNGKLPKKEREKLVELRRKYGGNVYLAYKVRKGRRKEIVYKLI